MPPAIILVQPREEGNVGAVARAMANMGLERLILVEPAPELGGTARGFGVGGWHILERAERAASFDDAVAPFQRVVGTSSRRERPLRRARIMAPRELPAALGGDPPGTETALVFGPEDTGLTRRQLERCSFAVTVPCASEHPTLNIAQAVLILAYELRLVELERPAGEPAASEPAKTDDSADDALAAAADVEVLLEQAARALARIGYDQAPIRTRLVADLRRLSLRAGATERDVRVLRRILNRVLGILPLPPSKV